MSKHAFIVLLVASFASLTATGQEATPSVSGDDALKVMSFNIRNGKARDGANHWDKRQQLVVKTITNYSPDLLGTQETYEFQAEFLQQNLPDYSHVGRGRETAPEKGEQCTVFFKTSRFEKLAEGHFWLSPKPEQPGSKGWDAALPRMVTWVKLKDLRTGHSFVWFNTHFDHRGERARVQSARLLAQRAPNIADGHAFIITGDFNAGLESEPYQAMFTGNKPGTRVIDTFREIAENNDKPQGTFNGFKGTDTGARIDWIGASKQFQVLAAGIDKFEVNGQYPSDHFPVTATLGFGK